jgi:hypothetical protein
VNYFGLLINTTSTASRIIGVHFQSDDYAVVRIYAADGTTVVYSNDSGGGGWANFSEADLNANTNYTIVAVPPGKRISWEGSTSYPLASTDFNVLRGMSQGLPLTGGNTFSFEFDKIVSQTYTAPPPTYNSSVNLTIGGGVGNITYTYSPSMATNITAMVNVTGFPVNITINNTDIANGITEATINYLFPADFWNVTAYTIGNATYNASSIILWANITKADNLLTLTNNASWTPTYPIATIISGNGNLTAANLYRNGSLITIPDNNLFGVGTYVYIWNTSGNSNYSANSTTKNLVIGKATPSFYITFVPNLTVVNYGATVLASCIFAGIPAEVLNVAGFYNDTSVTDASYYFNTSILGGGTYNFTCNSSATQNYTAYSVNKSLIVKAKIVIAVPVKVCFNIGNLANCFDYNTTDISSFSTSSKVFCSDNNTLAENITLLDGYNQSQAYHYVSCNNGCDSITTSCNPPVYIQTLILFGIITAVILGIWWLFR